MIIFLGVGYTGFYFAVYYLFLKKIEPKFNKKDISEIRDKNQEESMEGGHALMPSVPIYAYTTKL